ncbi:MULTISPECIES: hypothetical protein [Streptomyces]|uniref:hypothetical protein n=1 Tax=Streptomyces TaxID=1883 RepID=UPI00211D65A4|nr:hypothetical protein [Streptomyces sp. ms184]
MTTTASTAATAMSPVLLRGAGVPGCALPYGVGCPPPYPYPCGCAPCTGCAYGFPATGCCGTP